MNNLENILNKFKNCKRINILVIDDDSFIYRKWKRINSNCNFLIYSDFESVFCSFDQNLLSLIDIDLIITDYYFDMIKPGLNLYSFDFLGTLKEIYDYTGPIVLSTHLALEESEKIDLVIRKEAVLVASLLKMLCERSNHSDVIYRTPLTTTQSIPSTPSTIAGTSPTIENNVFPSEIGNVTTPEFCNKT